MKGTEGTLVGGRYRLDQPIGRGRAGIVWLAFDTMLYRTVAAKTLYLPPDRDPEQAKQLALREGQRATKVTHPSAVAVYDAFSDNGDVWLVMEYVPSRNMADFLAEHGELTPGQAAYLGVALASALSAAHAAGVPHSAVEPGNVLLADDGGVKITDFGFSLPSADPAFRAPEVANGEPATAASDAYSLGATLFTAVEGTPPFGPDGTGEPVVPRRTGPLTGALLKLLRTDPDLRPILTDTIKALQAISKGQQNGFVPPTAPAMPTVPLLPRPPRIPAQAGPTTTAAPRRGRLSSLPRSWTWSLAALVVAAAFALLFAVM
ncbi:protein kinase family protein [Saccharomonospora marina XMU15]|uniref:non-specific serine/threonine protein kinase n=1 Tax=Saccharomonospora marina XMU15 TaxID=882083 RepID=H5X7B3_9PSEU|nr:serine/threonine-protein kinase [Saccharomonospora marina]EHR49074.1 protein kinase family protein [Saccharomonospora marina XMU15]